VPVLFLYIVFLCFLFISSSPLSFFPNFIVFFLSLLTHLGPISISPTVSSFLNTTLIWIEKFYFDGRYLTLLPLPPSCVKAPRHENASAWKWCLKHSGPAFEVGGG
jgi:hypothetical protein